MRACGGGAAISLRHRLLSDAWTSDVEALECAIDRFKTGAQLVSHCEVVCFEVPGDELLHVNVTHRYATRPVTGWAGPGRIPDGYVHNRRFGAASRSAMIRHVREMVLAAPA